MALAPAANEIATGGVFIDLTVSFASLEAITTLLSQVMVHVDTFPSISEFT